ncbi:MAG: PQQ-binding-like beta-propeller repeat protein [Williamsia sp.]|nr:PQQ-binding-like beta-propeller repeat protein [Williamsia sp.]
MNMFSQTAPCISRLICASLLAGFFYLGGCKDKNSSPTTGNDWPAYGGNKQGNRYSPLSQITADNVKNLQVAWTYDAGTTKRGDIQCQPIVVAGILYGTTPDLHLFALRAETGREIWNFTPRPDDRPNRNRGVMYWEGDTAKRIFYTVGAGLYAVDAATGKPVAGFGKEGRVDLHEGLQTIPGYDVSSLSVGATSPGVIYKNTLVIGSTVSEGGDAAPGHIRAFDVITGKLIWVFHTIPQPGEFGYDTWPPDAYKKIGGVNSWSGMVLDEKRGLVYFGTGSPSADFYGGDRAGANLFANCIMALDAQTGKMKWFYQTIHHDLWDRDHPCPPNLATVTHNGKQRDVVVQATKDGLVYVLDRESGSSLFPVEERPVPVKGLPGEQPFATQKFPLLPAPFARQVYTKADLPDSSGSSFTPVRERYVKMQSASKFTPPDTIGTLLFGYSGGAEWGGNAVDPDGILYQNANEEPWELVMQNSRASQSAAHLSQGHALYLENCAACHGSDRKGTGAEIPSLVNIEKKRSVEDIKSLLKTGYGRMPQFGHLSDGERSRIVDFITGKEKDGGKSPSPKTADASKANNPFPYQPAYKAKTWRRFTGPDGYPGIKPPWGTLNAIDLNTGAYVWKVPLGEYPELAKKGVPTTGTVSYGGPLVTAGGLLFIAGTKDEKIRAFDRKTGKLVWEHQLPAGGFATPITYQVAGKQYIVIAAGGGREQQLGGNYIAFALKQ